jgi:SAM-dependent methyltransferase
MFSGHYINWRETRINVLLKYVPLIYFKSKSILELGCGYADIGNEFYKMGANITSSDARKEHLDVVNKKYPYIETKLINANDKIIENKYDIIIHWGLLYHLNEIENHLENISNICNILLLESEVCDSDNDSYYIDTKEEGYDQAYNLIGIRPSQSYVEKILKRNGFEYKLIVDDDLNSDIHCYNWEIKNTKTCKNGMRRFWICWKDINSPII